MSGNLRYKTRPVLINNLTAADFGSYLHTDPDTGTAIKHLIIKKIGLDIPVTNATVSNSKTKDGKLKSVLLALEAPTPESLSGYDNGFDIVKEVKNPGVLNDDWAKKARFYGFPIDALQTPSGGQIADSDKLIIEDAVIAQILADRGFGSREESIVDAKRVYLVTLTPAVTDSLTFTLANGTTATVAMGATSMLSCGIWNADAGVVSAGLMMFAKSTTQVYVTSVNAGTSFIIEGAGVTPPTIVARYIWVYARSVDVQFHVQFDKGQWTLSRFNVTVINNPANATGSSSFAIDGAIFPSVATNDTSSVYAAAINAESDGTAAFNTRGYASQFTAAVNVPVYVCTGIYELQTILLAGTTIETAYSGNGVYPSLTWEDVFREFSEAKHLDGLAHLTSLSQPAAGDKYNKLTFKWSINHATMHGASQQDTQLITQDVYIKQGFAATNLWLSTDFMTEAGTMDNTFLQMMTYFGSVPVPALV